MANEYIESTEQVIKWIPWKMTGKDTLFDPNSKISLQSKKRKAFLLNHSELSQIAQPDFFSLKSNLYKPQKTPEDYFNKIKEKIYLNLGTNRMKFLSKSENRGQKLISSLSPSKRLKFNHLNKAIFNGNERPAPGTVRMTSTECKKILLPPLRMNPNSLTPIPVRSYIIPTVKNIETNTETINDNFWMRDIYNN